MEADLGRRLHSPGHSWHRPSCGAGNPASSLERHTPDEAARCRPYPGPRCAPGTPAHEKKEQDVSERERERERERGWVSHLDHAWMVSWVVPGPGCPILHCPAFLWGLLGFCHESIDPHLKLFILSLRKTSQGLDQIPVLTKNWLEHGGVVITFMARRSLTKEGWILSLR